MRLDNRFLPPLLITAILVTAHLSFGILESYQRTALAIAVAIGAELVMGRLTFGTWPNPASAYITGISVGILVRSPFFWPYVLCSLISITSKYVLRTRDRHLWNPSNFGLSAVLFLAPDTVSHLSIQWGNVVAPMAVIWILGFLIVWRVGRLHISATYVLSFLALSFVRSAYAGTPWLATVAPITGPMYQLFIFFMVTDPKTTVRDKRAQCVVVAMVAVVETILRLNEVVYAPFYALFLVGPASLLLERLLTKQPPLPFGGRMPTSSSARSALIIALALVLVHPLAAHHSFGAIFDVNQPVTLTGTVTKIEWTNPHAHLVMDIKGADGKVDSWVFEGYPPTVLARTGWQRDVSVKVGDTVKGYGWRARDGSKLVHLREATLASGQRLFFGPPAGTGEGAAVAR
jgi:enediyne biosynthesis protein E5